jgi:hypothetical protein
MTTTAKRVNKTDDRKAYMREYMRQYNIKKYGIKRKQTDIEKKESLKQSHKKYYQKNKEKILKKQNTVMKLKRLDRLRIKLKTLESQLNI